MSSSDLRMWEMWVRGREQSTENRVQRGKSIDKKQRVKNKEQSAKSNSLVPVETRGVIAAKGLSRQSPCSYEEVLLASRISPVIH